jgi:hypothetical protein
MERLLDFVIGRLQRSVIGASKTSQIDQRQRRQGDQADAQYRRVRLDPTP